MNTEPLAFFREDFTRLFNQGVAQMKERADGGDAKAASRHADTAGARGAIRLVFEGDAGGELWLSVDGGEMKALDSAPEGLPVRMALAAPANAVKAALDEIEAADLLSREQAPYRVARTASAEIEKTLEGHLLQFHLTLSDLPADPDEVTIRIALGGGEPPTDPKFTATVSWDDIEDVRAGELTPQQLFGRLKLDGDATQAMALGMTLMQRRQAPKK